MLTIISTAFNCIAPTFMMIVAGYLCKRFGMIDEKDQPKMNAIGFRFFLPLQLFSNIYFSDLNIGKTGSLILFSVIGVVVIFFLALAYTMRFEKIENRKGVVIQAIYRSNVAMLGVPIAGALYSEAAAEMSVCIAFVIPLFNVLAVFALEMFNGEKSDKKKMLLSIARNPLIIGCVLGLIFLLSGIRLPAFLEKTVKTGAGVATPFMLFLLGVFFSVHVKFDRSLNACLLGRLIFVPLLALAAAVLFGFRNAELAVILCLFASPQAGSSFAMAQQMGGDVELAGNAVVLGTVLSFFSIILWVSVLMGAGLL